MAMPPEHRIGRVIFDLAAPDSGAVADLSGWLQGNFDAVVAPALDAALSGIDRADRTIRIGRVEVDLGTFDPELLDSAAIGQRIADALTAALLDDPAVRAPPRRARIGAAAFAESPELRQGFSLVEDLAGFLETGQLPWPGPGQALDRIAAALSRLDPAGMTRLTARLRSVLIRRRAAERLVRQLPAPLVRRILRALMHQPAAVLLGAAFGPDGPDPSEGAAPVPEALAAPLVEAILALARGGAGVPAPAELVALHAAAGHDLAPPETAPPPTDLPPAAARPTAGADLPPPALDPFLEDAVPAAEDAGTAPEGETPALSAAPIPVHAAGVVILHPFLGHFFEQIGLTATPERFQSPAAQARAVLLTHHLATGALDVPEPETPLCKLLCGMDLAAPLPRHLAITATEATEAAALLASVIAHWRRLGTTSPAGLREGFLTRPGLLDRQGEGWRLRVERRGIDILLDDLPWALSRVRTRFMAGPLAVDWR